MTRPDLICDRMLMRLARWLRMAGYDTMIAPDMDDKGISDLARSNGRVLLTRDKDLSNRKGLNSLRIVNDDLDDQLKEFLAVFPPTGAAVTRCPLCNGPLAAIDRTEIGREVPPKVRSAISVFYRCRSCSKTYWSGTHWDRIVEKLSSLGLNPTLPPGPEDKSNIG